jgi:hypothetical protein
LTAAVEIVSTEVAEPEPGTTVAGEKEQLNVLGSPAQERAMGVFKDPDCATAVTVKLPDCPAGIETADGEALNDNDNVGGGGGVIPEPHAGV